MTRVDDNNIRIRTHVIVIIYTTGRPPPARRRRQNGLNPTTIGPRFSGAKHVRYIIRYHNVIVTRDFPGPYCIRLRIKREQKTTTFLFLTRAPPPQPVSRH